MTKHDRGFQLIANAVMILLALFCILPFLLILISSLTTEDSLVRNGYSFFPEEWSLETYGFIFRRGATILRAYGISVFTTIVGTIFALVLTILTSYPLSRSDLPGRKFFSFYIFFTMLFNGGLVPTYILYTRYLKVNNTLLAQIVPYLLLNAFNVFLMRTYFQSNIPSSCIESAKIDGASEYRILPQIVLPMSKPVVVTMIVLIGLAYWNNWTNGLYFIINPDLFSIQNLLNRMLQDVQFLRTAGNMSGTSEIAASLPSTGIRMAVAVVGALPILIIYPFFQRYFVGGITVGAVKG